MCLNGTAQETYTFGNSTVPRASKMAASHPCFDIVRLSLHLCSSIHCFASWMPAAVRASHCACSQGIGQASHIPTFLTYCSPLERGLAGFGFKKLLWINAGACRKVPAHQEDLILPLFDTIQQRLSQCSDFRCLLHGFEYVPGEAEDKLGHLRAKRLQMSANCVLSTQETLGHRKGKQPQRQGPRKG